MKKSNTFPETNIAPARKPSQKTNVFQPYIFMCYSCYVRFGEGNSKKSATYKQWSMLHNMWCMEKHGKSKSFNCSGQTCLMEGGNTQMHPYPTTCSNLRTYEIHRSNLIRPPFLEYIESLSFSHQEVSPLTDWQQHRENPSPGVHTIQAVAPNKAMPAPATPVQRVMDTKWLADLAWVKVYQLQNIPEVCSLVCKQNHIHKSISSPCLPWN